MASQLDIKSVRKHFPALDQEQVYFDNAGGTQILGGVIDSISKYLSTNNVQLGATYKVGQLSTDAYNAGIAAAAKYVNASIDEIVIGPSTTQLFRNLAVSLLPNLPRDAELVISAVDHEANIASWVYLAQVLNLQIKWWKPSDSPTSPHLTPESLKPLLTDKTRLVTFTHTSNILGTITDVRAISDLVHSTVPNATVCVDAVAYAPHRPVDVKAFGVDFYAFSWYKLFGPHVAQLYASRQAQDRAMSSLGHFFKEGWTLEEKLGLAGASYELVAALPQVTGYLESVGWDAMVAHEEALSETLLKYLRSKPATYKIIGAPTSAAAQRVPVISFVVENRSSKDVVEKLEKRSDGAKFGFRWGHFYSKRLVDEMLKLQEKEGIIRVSMVHYNSLEEIQEFVDVLDKEVAQR